MIRRRMPNPEVHARGGSRGAAAAYWLIVFSSWCALNALAAIGLLALFFILFANATFEGFFREGSNLAAHYLAATPGARASFQHLIAWLFAGAFVLFAAIRLRALVGGLNGDAPPGSPRPTTSAT